MDGSLTFGVESQGTSVRAMGDLAAAAERAGLDAAWAPELYDRSATISVAEMANRTERCRVGTAIAYGVGRSPLTLAAEARDLDEISDGRFVLGIGNGTRRMISDWHGLDGDAPAVRMEELVPLLRQVWKLAEEPVDHDGRFYRLKLAALDQSARVPKIPIYTAGVGARMIESAGRVADGLIAHTMCVPRYLDDVARPAVERGAAKAERDPGEVAIATFALACAAPDAEVARREAAAMIAFYGTVKSYAVVFEHCGFGAEAKAIQEAFAKRDLKAMVGAVSEPMIDEFAAAGTPKEVDASLRRYDGVVDEVVLSVPSFQVTDERVAENLALLTKQCAPA